MKDPTFLTLAEIVEIHADQTERYGGETGLRELGLLESAAAQPEASFAGEWLHKDLYEMAAAYAYHICQNHPFVDGNKRTALASALVFLGMNGVGILDPSGKLESVLLKMAAGKVDKPTFSEILRQLPSKPA